MQAQYITLAAGVAKVVPLNIHNTSFEVSIRAPAATTIEVCLEEPGDSIAVGTHSPPVNPNAPVWVAAPNAVNANGVLHLTGTPYAAVRLTNASNGVATILQSGLR